MIKKIIILNFFFFFFSCKNEPSEPKSLPTLNENELVLTLAQQKNVAIKTVLLTTQTIATTLKVNGIIDVPPQNLVSVSVPLGGYLTNTKLLPGMHVNKGEIIAVIEDQQYIQLQQDYLVSKAKLDYAEKEFVRQTELNQSQASSNKVTQLAQAEFNTLKATTSGLSEKLKLIHINPNLISASKISKKIFIYASISGYVSKVNVNIGKYVSASDVLFELINPVDIHLNIKVYEKDIYKLKVGQKVLAYNNSQMDKKHLCEIILISKSIDPNGSSEVHCHFENYDKSLLPGMYMNADIALNELNANVIDEESVVSFEGKDYVFLQITKNKYRMQQVMIGERKNNFIEIKNFKVLQNKKIVTQGAYTLLMKLKNVDDE